MIHLIPGQNYIEQSEKLAKLLNAKEHNVYYKVFPDGELYARITDSSSLENQIVLIVNTMYPRQNDSLIETLMLINAAKLSNPKHIILYIPYIAYARQDRVFLEGEPVSIDIVLKSLRMIGGEYLLTIDIHNPDSLKFFGDKTYNILVSDKLVEHALNYTENPILIAPDEGALNRVKYAAEKHELEYDHLIKHRDRVTGKITFEPKEVNVRNKDLIIIDDIISTGGTIAKASKTLLKRGARKIIVAASHGLLINNAIEKIKSAGVLKILLADTLGVKRKDPLIEYIDINEIISSTLKEELLKEIE